MKLHAGGIDIFYIDESQDKNLFVATAIAIPFMRWQADGWHIVWPEYLDSAHQWRQVLAKKLSIASDKELHGLKLAKGRGHYRIGQHPIPLEQCAPTYEAILQSIDFLPDTSIISVADVGSKNLFGERALKRVILTLFKYMQRHCSDHHVQAMVFFDQGHPEYRTLYRQIQAQIARDQFIKDGNEKNSRHCPFTQLADLVAYAALAKMRYVRDTLSAQDITMGLHRLYDALPARLYHPSARKDGIIWLG